MEKVTISEDVMSEVIKAIPHILKFPLTKTWLDYDKEADVLYISFYRPQKATDTEMTEDGVLFRYRDDEIVGITIMDASKR